MADQLGSAVLTVSVDTKPLEAGFRAAQQYAARAGQAIGQGIAGSSGTLTGLNIKLNSLQTELQNVQIGTRRFRELRGEIEAAEKALNKAQGISSGGLLGGIATGLAGLGVGAAVASFLKGSIDAAIELETITKKLSNTLGEQGAGGAIAFTKGLSDQLGLSFKTLAGSFASFTAAASAANVPIQVQKDLFGAVAKAAQQLGLSNDEINGSLLALQQIASKGNVQMEELRGQLGERLPVAFAAAAKGLNLTQQELIKLIEGGRLTAREFFPALTKGLNDLTKGSEGAPTAAQNFQILGNAWDSLQTSFGQSLVPTVTEQIKNLTNVLEGVGVVIEANKLGLGGGILTNALGIIPDEGAQAVGALRSLQTQFNLTDKQARALFTDAIADAGGKYNPFGQLMIGSKEFDKALASLFDRATAFRERNQDTTGDLQKQQAEAARLLEIAKAREDAEKKILGPSRQVLDDARAVQGLQGFALAQAQEQLKLDQLRRTEKQAIADYDSKLSGAGFNRESPAVIEAAAKVKAAGNAVQAALITGSDALRLQGGGVRLKLIEGATALRDAGKQLREDLRSAKLDLARVRNSPTGLNQYLNSGQIEERGQATLASLLPQFRLAQAQFEQLTGGRAPEFSGTTSGVIDSVLQFIDAVRRENIAGENVANLQKALAKNTADLVNINAELLAATRDLAAKSWAVNVNVPGGSASGDTLKRVNGGF